MKSKLVSDFGIRALFGTLLIAGFIASFFYVLVNFFTQSLDIEVLKLLVGLVKDVYLPVILLVVGFYYGQRASQGSNNKE